MRIEIVKPVTTRDIAIRLGVSRRRAWKILESLVRHGAIRKFQLKNNLYAPIGKRVRTSHLPEKYPLREREYDIIRALGVESLSYVTLAKRMGIPKETLRGKLNYMVTKGILNTTKSEYGMKKYAVKNNLPQVIQHNR